MAAYYDPGRRDFDLAFERAKSRITESLGLPWAQGQYVHDHRPDWTYSYATWPGPAGVLILRQDELDIQFGMEVNVWVQPWDSATPLPTPPIGF
jgi:hypothetical protein